MYRATRRHILEDFIPQLTFSRLNVITRHNALLYRGTERSAVRRYKLPLLGPRRNSNPLAVWTQTSVQ